VPGWSQYYLDYKFLKKIISSLADKRPATEAASLALGVRPGDLLETPLGTPSPKEPPWRSPHAFDSIGGASRPILVTQSAEDKDPGMQAHKAAFFFKLERELERVRDCLDDVACLLSAIFCSRLTHFTFARRQSTSSASRSSWHNGVLQPCEFFLMPMMTMITYTTTSSGTLWKRASDSSNVISQNYR
jgi:hypothetical protein